MASDLPAEPLRDVRTGQVVSAHSVQDDDAERLLPCQPSLAHGSKESRRWVQSGVTDAGGTLLWSCWSCHAAAVIHCPGPARAPKKPCTLAQRR